MTINQTNNNQSACEQLEDLVLRCFEFRFPDELKNSCIFASLNGHTNPSKLSNVKKWENCASFTINDNPAFMMRGSRGYISIVIEDGEAIFLADLQFWSENAIFNSTSNLPSPNEYLTAFYLNIEMMIEEELLNGAEQAIEKLYILVQGTQLDGYLPKPELIDISPKIEQLVLNKFSEFNLIFAEYDFSLEYAGNFMMGSINNHTFEITRTFNGLRMSFDVVVTSNDHLNLSINSGKVAKVIFS